MGCTNIRPKSNPRTQIKPLSYKMNHVPVSRARNAMEILLVEDNPKVVEMTKTAIAETHVINRLNIVESGEAALAYLHQEGTYSNAPRPDLILLALDMPRKN